ncbi:tigger transposable element-derived protein 1-like [Plakobranchus ocellatus]|uniref:Tigger transposable element-derived protein 1-like n=1 Tax=Plakobranchus ocellatus TaxID=259542 RepID=A0AAV3YUA7_9GAST|nr:tigger transposable element-derived protein 1-like [Plakobranchus ocellatus]
MVEGCPFKAHPKMTHWAMAAAPCRGSWTQQELENAMRAINRGERISVREASKQFGIPRRTLPNHISSGSTEKRLGRKPLLSDEEEQLPVDRIARKAQAINPARAQKLNRFIVNDHFTKLDQAIIDLDLFDKPDRIFNLDEKGCCLSLHHQQRVIALKGNKRVHLVAPEHGENVTVVACVRAVGGVIPPMIIFKGKNRKQQFSDDLPPLACFEMAEKGSMTNELFVKWLQHFSKFKPQGSILLIFDGAKCHLPIDKLEEADRHNITLFCLLSNTAHELQPLDTAVFRSFEHHWDQEVLNFWRNRHQRSLSKDVFGKVFTPVWTKCMTMANIQSGFRKCGIYPFNKDAIPEHAFAPSEVTQMDVATSDDAPPQPSTSQDNPTYSLTSQDAPPQSSTSQDAPPQSSTSQDAPPQSSTTQDAPPHPSTSQHLSFQPPVISPCYPYWQRHKSAALIVRST